MTFPNKFQLIEEREQELANNEHCSGEDMEDHIKIMSMIEKAIDRQINDMTGEPFSDLTLMFDSARGRDVIMFMYEGKDYMLDLLGE